MSPDRAGRPASSNNHRGARIRTGDLCDPNAALYRTEPRPANQTTPTPGAQTRTDGVGFEPTRVFSPTRFPIVRLKPLGHPSRNPDESGGTRPCSTLPGSIPTRSEPESGRGPTVPLPTGGSWIRTEGERGWRRRRHRRSTHASPRRRRGPWVRIPDQTSWIYRHGGSGIRTHAGRSPTP